uniref:J domain-containing protein n=1 Tax=Tetraselmis chuii TaxID=63592 RepID=A0A7S1X6C6_9CHLO|mmetsp:Transcript_33101/g.59283  ORF Transcript_33101/g.59283 Transcript_33101/m.59283 type:complete len:218 (+) Transcript_33101:1-654(+)
MARDFYSVLEVPRGASQDEVKSAYRALAKKFHPDRHQSSPEHLKTDALARFKEVSQAYEVLGDANKRAVYDVSGRSAAMRAGGGASSSYGGSGYSGNPYHGRYYDRRGQSQGRYADGFFRQLRRGLTPQNLLVHGALLGTLLAGVYVANHTGQTVWETNNRGRRFSDLRAVAHSRKQQLVEERRQEMLARRCVQQQAGNSVPGDPPLQPAAAPAAER